MKVMDSVDLKKNIFKRVELPSQPLIDDDLLDFVYVPPHHYISKDNLFFKEC